ncbi:w0003 [Escherichia coli]|nr:w0003 [Escherichia coli]SQM26738.1 w0003 [Escherichia coli]
MQQRDVFSDQASIASWALFTLHRKKLYEYRNANEQNISVKMSSPEHYIVAAVELDDASHLRPERRRRDILLEEVLRQAGIPLLRSHDARKLLQMTGEWLDTFRADLQSEPGSSRSENVHRFTRQHQVSETAVRKVKSDSCMEGNK